MGFFFTHVPPSKLGQFLSKLKIAAAKNRARIVIIDSYYTSEAHVPAKDYTLRVSEGERRGEGRVLRGKGRGETREERGERRKERGERRVGSGECRAERGVSRGEEREERGEREEGR